MENDKRGYKRTEGEDSRTLQKLKTILERRNASVSHSEGESKIISAGGIQKEPVQGQRNNKESLQNYFDIWATIGIL